MLSDIASLHITKVVSAPFKCSKGRTDRRKFSDLARTRSQRESRGREPVEAIKVGLDILQSLTHLGPKEHWQPTVATNDHYREKSTPSCPVRPSKFRTITLDVSYSPSRNILQLRIVSTKPCKHKNSRDTYLVVRLMISLLVVLYCFASAKRAAMPTKNERIASKPVNMAILFAILTDSRIKVCNNRSEYDDGQLDRFAPFRPLKVI
jgi:hypothetical protein